MSGALITRFDELRATQQLPSPSGVGMAILSLTQNENVAIPEIARVLQTDPSIAGRVLKFANSLFVGLKRPISAISDAVVVLGIRTVRQLALGFSVLSHSRTGACKRFDYQGFWSRSMATAVAAQAIACRVQTVGPEETYTCGLLSQVGALGLATVHPEKYAEVLAQCSDNSPLQLTQLEQQTFAMDHNELTAAMLKDWGLPELCVEAVLHHEQPDGGNLSQGSREHTLARILHLAAQMATVCVSEHGQRGQMVPELLACAEQLHLDSSAVDTLFDQMVKQWQEWGAILNVPTHQVPSFSELADSIPSDSTAETELSNPRLVPQESLRILVADDDVVSLGLLTKHLQSTGHAVQCAKNGREALALALDESPQMLITDWVMPDMDGLDLCKALRKTQSGRQVYVIMLTGCENEDRLVQAFEAGVDDYVVKPFSPKSLAARIRAGQRVIQFQAEIARDKEEIRQHVAELAVANRKLESAAMTDALTGLRNRRYAIDRLAQEWSAASRSGRTLGCLMIDIDNFKKINDAHGHGVGDLVLQEMATLLKNSTRTHDTVCRLGGEEFLVICSDSDVDAAQGCAERLRRAVEAHVIQTSGSSIHVTVSIGVAARDQGMDQFDALLNAADRGLYTAKHNGRNRVCVAFPARLIG